jgi:hypothetical protein
VTAYKAVPDWLTAREQWVAWRNECRSCGEWHESGYKDECESCGDDEVTTVPKDPETGRNAIPGDASTWTDFETAVEYDESSDTHGIGFMFDADGPVVGVDLDDCRDPETGDVDDWAIDIVTTLHSYAEVSPSGTGLHALAFGKIPDGGSRKDGVEMYDEARYFTVTGNHYQRSPSNVNYREDEIEAVHSGYIESGGRSGGAIQEADLEGFDPSKYADGKIEQDTFENDLGETLSEAREQDEDLDAALEELEPGYDLPQDDNSPSGYDFSVASKLWKRRFDVEQIYKILLKYRKRPADNKLLRPTYIEPTLARAAGGERFDPRQYGDVSILDDRVEVDSIEDVDFDRHRNFVLDKPPREGGSHATIDQLSNRPLVILASRHAICEHHREIASEVMPDDKSIVHLEGSSRACEHGGGDCPKRRGSEDFMEINQVIEEAKEVLAKKTVVTKEHCPDRFCRHQFITYAAVYAHAVVTVPNLLPKIDEKGRWLAGNNLLIDEEQALGYFRPPSVDLAEIETGYEPDGTKNIQVTNSNISTQLATLTEIRKRIWERWREGRRENESGEIQPTPIEKDVLAAIAYLECVADAMAVSDIAAEIDDATSGDVVREVRERIEAIPVPEPRVGPADFRSKVEEYAERYYYDDSVDPGAMIESVLFGYNDRKLDFKRTGGSFKIRLIGGRHVFHPDVLMEFDRVGVIAGPEGEMLLDDLELDATVIDITEFRYAEDFVTVPVGKQIDERMEPTADQRRRARQVSRELNGKTHPHLTVTGTKGRAREHHESLDSGPAGIVSSPTSPAKETYGMWTVGDSAIIYENSAVSRGVDTPWFDVIVVASSGFAAPYWEARKRHARQAGDVDEYDHARSVEEQLKAHELTNAVLRPAPTRDIDQYTGTKFIVIADWDAPRLRYLDQEMPTFARAESAANVLENLTIGGGLRERIDRDYRALGSSESEFIKLAMKHTFEEMDLDAPSYDLDELETWAENGWFSTEGTVDRVEAAVPPRGEVETSYVTKDQLKSWASGRSISALEILNRMGIISMRKQYRENGGRPRRLWSKKQHD